MPEPVEPHGPLVRVCASSELVDGGRGVRFAVALRFARDGSRSTGFVVRYDGKVYAYLNQCAHVPAELDWQLGEFFDHSGLYLMCATHGAVYWPDSGRCAGGPCRGAGLRPLGVVEKEGAVYWQPDERVRSPEP